MAMPDVGRSVDAVEIFDPLRVEHVLLARFAHPDLAHLHSGAGQLQRWRAGTNHVTKL